MKFNDVLNLFKRIWNKDVESQIKWKGSYPEWRWKDSSSVNSWLEWRREEEGAENLWRIHDKLYDLELWTDKHPGGSSWISTTKGTDITEAFECHHISDHAESILPKYFVRNAKTPRNSPFTFHEDGFFRTLKREINKNLNQRRNSTSRLRFRSAFITDSLLLTSLLLAVCGAMYSSYFLCILSGVLLCFVTICAHNYFHQKDNFRMYYFNLSLLSYRDWRISHALSHHLYPNSRYDLEVTLATPFLQWLPKGDKTFFARYLSWFYSPFSYIFIFYKQFLERVFINPDGFSELIPLIYPAVMILLGGSGVPQAVLMWQVIILAGSFTFGLIGVNAAHHHPDIFHDGDFAREDKDWGLYQLDAVRDRLEFKGKLPIVMVTFGDHSMHHLFPTLDHAELITLYPVLMDVCKKFDFDFTFSNQLELMKGQFQQLARTQPKINYKPCKSTL